MVASIDNESPQNKKSNRRPPNWWIAKYGAWTKEDFQFIKKIQSEEGGVVKVANTTAKEQMFRAVTYDKVEVIQGLLRFYHDFKNKGHEDFTEEVVVIYADIDKAMSKIKVTARQSEATKLYMEGWAEEEIGNMLGGISHQAVHKLVMKVCSKVSEYLKGDE